MTEIQNLSERIKSLAAELGFFHCGIAKAKRLDEDAVRLENWLNKNYHGSMSYMANHFDLRVDPMKLVPGAKSVITLLMNYYPDTRQQNDVPQISKYAYGSDYHEVIRTKLNELLFRVREIAGNVNGRGFVDSAPVLERAWARESGLGWIGKNGNLIHKGAGSFFFIATLITDLDLQHDTAFAGDYCGTCRKCIDACPTDAILENKTINGSQCISYFTIELKEMLIPGNMQGKFGDWLFGCDVCQDVCPWNRFSKPHSEAAFKPIPGLLNMSSGDWEALGEEQFRKLFRYSPLKRSKYQGILRNLRFIQTTGPSSP
ncbi:tRNA epoxyqueuosine(34) reductase QueG [Flavihumibacter stibioxidans]|uniref:Epoxyqueuosine reductase n=1 Tax=Flavihumibacter stibioxidans TaxID=1834163 RepID=A0ABR7MDQ7_9BACT|nr:tRNA epoxyqueuosine(34) reductase QueG [Flavihumibacter stibioxidans]MBC6493091.1 tRNA epoxyqueuosine(34) reductase QueG [Flavihumibacter stibioxidans]